MQLTTKDIPCDDSLCTQHPNTRSLLSKLFLPEDITAGTIKAQLLNAQQMRQQGGRIQMWLECQSFDGVHEGAKLDKVENHLANESFAVKDRQRDVDEASAILHIEELWAEKSYRGRGLGWWMIERLLQELKMTGDGMVMLQAGPVSRETRDREDDTLEGLREDGGESAHEKLARHWKKLGFDEWSDSDDAWLLLKVCELKSSELP
jgi:GNAT superfamily N-acetyltransferase